jgi:hypothetical protein
LNEHSLRKARTLVEGVLSECALTSCGLLQTDLSGASASTA